MLDLREGEVGQETGVFGVGDSASWHQDSHFFPGLYFIESSLVFLLMGKKGLCHGWYFIRSCYWKYYFSCQRLPFSLSQLLCVFQSSLTYNWRYTLIKSLLSTFMFVLFCYIEYIWKRSILKLSSQNLLKLNKKLLIPLFFYEKELEVSSSHCSHHLKIE